MKTGTEFSVIADYFAAHVMPSESVVLGIGDDAAVISMTSGKHLVTCTDTLVEGVHFPTDALGCVVGYRALAVNISDFAAMGAEPRWAQLALTLPEIQPAWLQSFQSGFFELAACHRIVLVGGDLTQGPLSITVQLMGEASNVVRRSGAKVGDDIYVTGTLGDSGVVYRGRLDSAASDSHRAYFLGRYERPQPRLAFAAEAQPLFNAAIDISDGFVADLGHLLLASHCGAEVVSRSLPLSSAMLASFGEDEGLRLALSSGDDYELCFTAAKASEASLYSLARSYDLRLSKVGSVVEEPGLRVDGKVCVNTGWEHFRA